MLTKTKPRVNFIVPLSVILAATLFMFYIDEGYYDFRWMKNLINWVAFFLYISFMFTGYALIRVFLFKSKEGFGVEFLSTIIGSALFCSLLIWCLS